MYEPEAVKQSLLGIGSLCTSTREYRKPRLGARLSHIFPDHTTFRERSVTYGLVQSTHGTGKTGKMATKKSLSGKTQGIWKFCQNTGNFDLNTGNLLAQVVNVLILKVKDIAIVVAKKSNFFRSWIGLPSQFCVCNTHKLCKLAQGKFAVRQGKHREFENT